MSSRRAFQGLVLLSALLLAYTTYRAAVLSLTYDEGWTLAGIGQSVGQLLTWHGNDVNTHPLNSILMKVARRLLGASPFVYRLPNVAAHAVYLAASLALARRARSVAAMLAGFALLNLNPFLLDFFSLARGYGLALACTLAGLVCLSLALERPGWRWETAACACLAAATVANLAFLHGLAGVAFACLLLALEQRRLSSVLGPAAVTLGLLACVFPPMRRLQQAGQFYFGGFDSFWGDTVGSLTQTLLYRDGRSLLSGALALLVGVAVAALAVAALRSRRKPALIFLLVLCLPALTTTLLHEVAGSRFLLERTALLFVPLFAVAVQEGASAAGPRTRAVLLGVALLLLVNTARAANVRYTLSWRYDADVKRVVQLLEREHRRTGRPIHLVMSWPFKFPVYAYAKLWNLDWLRPEVFEYGEKKLHYDYCYILEDDYAFGYRLDRAFLEERRGTIVRAFPLSGSSLLRGDGP
ncbi:MAG TPA: hypothetical protein VFV75_01430 [Candidatus Polarisedimenticolaceae bacterium]|nr:hypothetical protein [Candidatus Polarisedimenticolaceae bacterium]